MKYKKSIILHERFSFLEKDIVDAFKQTAANKIYIYNINVNISSESNRYFNITIVLDTPS